MEKSMIRANDIVQTVSAIYVIGDPNREIYQVAPLDNAGPNDLSYCNFKGADGLNLIKASGAGTIICDCSIPDVESFSNQKCIITVTNARLSFVRCINKFFSPEIKWGVHPSAVIEPDVKLPNRVYVGPMAYISHHVEIGENTVIENGVQVGAGVKIGQNVLIQPGAVLGCTGQGFERTPDGTFEKFPQLGWIVIEDDVEIGANSTIVRGALAETRIKKGSKIGHLTDIGHNVQIGQHVFVSAGAVVCGSAKIGDFAWLSPKCCIKNKVSIGANATIGLGAVVVKDVPDGWTVVGVPARRVQR